MDTGNVIILSRVGISPSKKEGEASVRYEETTTRKPKATFRGFKSVYDSKAENNTRWLNFNFEAYGDVVEKMKKMALKEKSFINIMGHIDQSSYKDGNDNTRMFEKIIIDHVEYAQMAKSGSGKTESTKPAVAAAATVKDPTVTPMPGVTPVVATGSKAEGEFYGEALDAPGYAGTLNMDDDEMPFDI